jgi:hypothetical protein
MDFPRYSSQFHSRRGGKWSDFPDWLRHGSGVYWTNGKAGASFYLAILRFPRSELLRCALRRLRRWYCPKSVGIYEAKLLESFRRHQSSDLCYVEFTKFLIQLQENPLL